MAPAAPLAEALAAMQVASLALHRLLGPNAGSGANLGAPAGTLPMTDSSWDIQPGMRASAGECLAAAVKFADCFAESTTSDVGGAATRAAGSAPAAAGHVEAKGKQLGGQAAATFAQHAPLGSRGECSKSHPTGLYYV
jgi:hypothetical protein